ncbi:MAG: hypothetical protein QOG77_4095, partial [Solirubrobacteraceae bacterium]|nr:hypothetical protein [Solirubrobacteraceae bacterium]
RVLVDRLPNGDDGETLAYDSLVVATGSVYTYFGHDEWRELAPDVKSPESALDVRRRVLTAFEAAEVETDADRRAAWLTFVVVGAGPTGVELAGQLAEMARHTLRWEFRRIDTADARILLVEMADRVLPGFPRALSRNAQRTLSELGVTPLLDHRVLDIDETGVLMAAADDEDAHHTSARTVVWAAGTVGSSLAGALADGSGADLERGGRVRVDADLTLPGHPEVLAIGDMAAVHGADGRALGLPGLAPVAMQQGRHAAHVIEARLRGAHPPPFHYRDKGNLATIGRAKAVADLGTVQLSGAVAWLAWLVVHLFFLIDMQNRLLVLIRWGFSYVTRSGGARVITEEPAHSATARVGHSA